MSLAIVGGYRLVRRLSDDRAADLWVAASVADEHEQAPVALKLYRSEWPADRIATEIESLARAAGPHVVAVIDLATTVDGRTALVLEKLGTVSLAGLLARRGCVAPGEAVTILAPLAQALSRMHRAGVAHGGLRAASVGFRRDGAPVIADFEDAVVLPVSTSRAQRDRHEALREDARDFRALCEQVVAGSPASEGILLWLEENATNTTWFDNLPARLFAWAASTPIDFDQQASAAPAAGVTVELRRSRTDRSSSRGLSVLARALIESDWKALVVDQVRRVRPRFWAIGGGMAALLVIAGIVIPGDGGDATAGTGSTPAPTPVATAIAAEDDAVGGDDPVAALRVLLDARAQCIRELSILCLDSVDQAGSAALEEDHELIRGLQEGTAGDPDLFKGELELTEELGGTALISISVENAEPASILVMRSEAGWRIRDYLD